MADRLPLGHLERPKRGFNLAVGRWVQGEPRLLEEALRRLRAHEAICEVPIVSLTHEQTWALLVLDEWLSVHDSTYPS